MESPGDREGRGVPRGYVEQQKVDIPAASMAGRKAVAPSFESPALPVRMDVDFGVLSGWWRGLEVFSKGVHSFDAIFRAALELLESTKEQVRWFLNPSSTLPPAFGGGNFVSWACSTWQPCDRQGRVDQTGLPVSPGLRDDEGSPSPGNREPSTLGVKTLLVYSS